MLKHSTVGSWLRMRVRACGLLCAAIVCALQAGCGASGGNGDSLPTIDASVARAAQRGSNHVVGVAGNVDTIDSRDVEPVISEVVLRRWGYRTVRCSRLTRPTWYTQLFGRVDVVGQDIVSLRAVPDMPRTRYRFSIERELYADSMAAGARFDGADRISDDYEKTRYRMCRGIRCGRSVILVSTDVNKFLLDELPSVFEKVRRQLN